MTKERKIKTDKISRRQIDLLLLLAIIQFLAVPVYLMFFHTEHRGGSYCMDAFDCVCGDEESVLCDCKYYVDKRTKEEAFIKCPRNE